ncbi:alpha/beta hydrolase family esterase [Enterovirga aerilata]|uniref:Esterase n=1 Tax=Enterovirga aerilata TaxID=2730920 RepID=A0A849IFL9_9HYPH|nr:PHB depolymerase family esterase [Enterovirga sp. DB1703]NNM75239.1 esterase [Enterovirga sp. DB1703]
MLQVLTAIATFGLVIVGVTAGAAADRSGQLQVGDRTRTYVAHVPDGPPPPRGFPVILAFHGGGGDGARMRRLTRLDRLADASGVITVYPDGVGGHWNDGRSTIRNPQDDVGFVAALLDRVAATAPVDQRRIYATGLSNGALFAERLACDLSHRIAAIAPVAGTMPADLAVRCKPAHPVAVLQISGTADPIMPFSGGPVADFGGRGQGGQVLSVADAAAFWRRRNGCGGPAAQEALRPIASFDPTRILRTRYTGCTAGAPVTVLTVMGGGHAWPGGAQFAPPRLIGPVSRQLDASRAIIRFFLSLPRR